MKCLSTLERDCRRGNNAGASLFRTFRDKIWEMNSNNETILYLIRHGETEGNLKKAYQGQNNTPLTELGRRQAQQMGKRIGEIGVDIVISSDLGRSMETASIACSGTNREIIPHPGLRERHFGMFQGMKFDDAKAKYPDIFARYRGQEPDFRIPEGETWREFISRIKDTLEEIGEGYRGKTCALFTHGAVVGYFFAYQLGFFMEPGDLTYKVANGSFTKYLYREGKFVLLSFGDTHHMEKSAED